MFYLNDNFNISKFFKALGLCIGDQKVRNIRVSMYFLIYPADMDWPISIKLAAWLLVTLQKYVVDGTQFFIIYLTLSQFIQLWFYLTSGHEPIQFLFRRIVHT